MNPWNALPLEPPFVLPSELGAIEAFNNGQKPSSPYRIHTGRFPEPRLGPKDAPLVILQMNPSFDTNHLGPLTAAQVLSARQSVLNELHPHSCLASSTPWWNSTFKELLKLYDRKCLSENVCSIEYFPYPSRKFGHGRLSLPSQQYSFDLAKAALQRKAFIVVTRGLDLWIKAVPGLDLALNAGQTVFTTKNRQRPYISANNLVPSGAFQKICAVLNRKCGGCRMVVDGSFPSG